MIYLLDVIYMYYNMPPQTPYNPYYGNSFYMDPQEYIKQNERKKLRKTSNGIGFYIMAYFLTMQTVAIVIALVFSSLNLDTSNPTAEYLLDIFLSVVASFIPGLIYLGASKFKISEAFKKTYVPIGLLLSLVFIGMALAMVSNVAAQMLDDNLSIFGLENSASMSNDQALNPLQTFLYIRYSRSCSSGKPLRSSPSDRVRRYQRTSESESAPVSPFHPAPPARRTLTELQG